MSHALGNEVVDYNMELEKSTADIQILIDEVKENVEKTLNEFREIQSVQNQRLDKLEDAVENEVSNFKNLINDLSQQFEAFKQGASSVVAQTLASGDLDSEKLNRILEAHEHRLEELGQLQSQVDEVSKLSPENLREELVSGIRMLGDRISKAIAEINERIDNFTDEIHTQVTTFNGNLGADVEALPEQDDDDFASLKESKLLDESEFEIVPREAIKRLTELFKKQSSAVKSFIGKHEQKIEDFEKLLKTYDDENTHLLELLDRRVKRNFLISMAAVVVVILCSIAMRIF